jgi:hypothetical protein
MLSRSTDSPERGLMNLLAISLQESSYRLDAIETTISAMARKIGIALDDLGLALISTGNPSFSVRHTAKHENAERILRIAAGD